YYLLKLPELLNTALPVALLLAMLYALTTHARHNELIAIRAAGVSLWRICVPYFAVGVLLSMAFLAINERLLVSDLLRRTKAMPIRDVADYLRLHPTLPRRDRALLETQLQGRM